MALSLDCMACNVRTIGKGCAEAAKLSYAFRAQRKIAGCIHFTLYPSLSPSLRSGWCPCTTTTSTACWQTRCGVLSC